MMKKFYEKLSITAGMLLMLTSMVLAQDRSVSGTVSDGKGSVMPGVNVVIQGNIERSAVSNNNLLGYKADK